MAPKFPEFPSWAYGPNGESQVFQTWEDVPVGWNLYPKDSPKSRIKEDVGASAPKPPAPKAAEAPAPARGRTKKVPAQEQVTEFDRDAAVQKLLLAGYSPDIGVTATDDELAAAVSELDGNG